MQGEQLFSTLVSGHQNYTRTLICAATGGIGKFKFHKNDNSMRINWRLVLQEGLLTGLIFCVGVMAMLRINPLLFVKDFPEIVQCVKLKKWV